MAAKNKVKFGTFSGVMVPSILAIFGAVMYLILPKVLGNVGLIPMLAIVVLAHMITIATAFSISSIVTNIQVKGGGLYYLISRSLGRSFGGSMGIQLFLAQTIAAAFYTIAFTKMTNLLLQSVNIFFPENYLAMIFMFIMFLMVFRGVDFVIKIQYIILIIIALSIISIFLAPHTGEFHANLINGVKGSLPFWVAFAMFFPAVTGIDAGVGMSGELSNPKKNLVRGTFASILITMTIYLLLVVKLADSANPQQLITDPFIVKNIALVPILIVLGILTATISSALSCLMTAPRSLRAMVGDEVLPKKLGFLGKSIGKSTEPHFALIVSLIIAEIIIFMGGLDIVSIIVSMFFLNVYGWINGAAFFEKISKNPSFRPIFNTPWFISLFGMIACYFVMYLFNPYVMLIGILFQVIVFYMLTRTKSSQMIESVWEGVLFQAFRGILRKIEENYKGRKNWRPTIISFSTKSHNRNLMLTLADSIGSSISVMKFYVLLQDKEEEEREREEKTIKEYAEENNLEIFPKAILIDDKTQAMKTIVQSETLGKMTMNTVLLDYDKRLPLHDIASFCEKENKNLILLRNLGGITNHRIIDVWWKSPNNGNLMIMIAHLISNSSKWRNNNPVIRLFSIAESKEEVASMKEKLARLVDKSRIENVEIQVIDNSAHEPIDAIMHKHSQTADLAIIGLPKVQDKINKLSMKQAEARTKKLNTTIIINSYSKINFDMN